MKKWNGTTPQGITNNKMGYIRKSQKSNIVDMAEYKGRKARKQTDAAHNPSKKSNLNDDASPYGMPRPTGAGKTEVWTE